MLPSTISIAIPTSITSTIATSISTSTTSQGNCKNRSVGMECEVGLRRKTYNVLTGGWCDVLTC